MFYGERVHKMDNKGRVSFPSKFRQKISGSLIITRGDENCLIAYPQEEWDEYGEKLKRLPSSDKLAQAYIRDIYSYAEECVIDTVGRIKLTDKLANYASITDTVVFIGKPGKIELWSPEVLEKHRDEALINKQALAEHMANLGI